MVYFIPLECSDESQIHYCKSLLIIKKTPCFCHKNTFHTDVNKIEIQRYNKYMSLYILKMVT